VRLLVDLQGMQNGSRDRGIGRYVASIIREIAKLTPPEDLRVIVSDLFPDTIDDVLCRCDGTVTRDQVVVFHGVGPTAEMQRENAWRRHASQLLYEDLVARLAPDVLLIGSAMEGAGDNSIAAFPPDRSYRVATILYDLIPLINPKTHLRTPQMREWYDKRLALALASDRLLAISGSAREEAIAHTNCDPANVTTIYAAASSVFERAALERDAEEDASLLAYFGIEREFIMFVSAFDSRKNFHGLVKAFARLSPERRASLQLVLVCKINDRQREELGTFAAGLGVGEDELVLTGFVPDEDLRVLYAASSLFVFPSLHEGFGLPILEAMWCGAPAIGSSRSSVPEVIGLPEALFDPDDLDGMAAMIERALSAGEFRDRLLAHATRHCRTFSWERTARAAIEALHEILRDVPAKQALPLSLDDLIAKLTTWPAKGGPSGEDLARLARAITGNLAEAAHGWAAVGAGEPSSDATFLERAAYVGS